MERIVQNESEFFRMCNNVNAQSDFFRMVFPIVKKYDGVSFGQPIGMSVYNAIVEATNLFNERLNPIFEDYRELKKELEELKKGKGIIQKWLGFEDYERLEKELNELKGKQLINGRAVFC
jgi:hypothetical protein